jgi:hypothetical protein
MKPLAIILTTGALLAACGTSTGVQTTTWSATLAPEPAFPTVAGTAMATSTGTQIQVTASLTGVPQGSVLPWHIHFGTCDNDQGIVGSAGAYPHLEPNAAGEATATANVAAVLQPGQPYFVNVHASPQDLPTIVACGALTMN